MNYAQEYSVTSDGYTEPFPLGIVVYNDGETVAQEVVLSIIAGQERWVLLKFNGLQVETVNVLKENGFEPLHKIKLGNINPGERVFLDENIFCKVVNIHRFQAEGIMKNGTKNVFVQLKLQSITLKRTRK